MIRDENERNRVAAVLGEIVDRIARTQCARRTQEPAITSKIGQALEDARLAIGRAAVRPRSPIDVRIMVQDIPDRGKGSLEKKSGVDLYVNISVQGEGRTRSKGILIQAKKGEKRENLVDQCKKMRERSDASYTWIYTPEGCLVINAADILDEPALSPSKLPRRTPTEVFDKILECSEGDERIGIDDGEGEEAGLERVMQELEAPAGIDFIIREDGLPRRWRPSRRSFIRRI